MSWAYASSVLTSTGGTSGSPDLISVGLAALQTADATKGFVSGKEGWVAACEIRVASGSWVKLDDDFQIEVRTSAFINPQSGGFEMGGRSKIIMNTTTGRTDGNADFETGSSFVCRRNNPQDPNPSIVYTNTARMDFPTIVGLSDNRPALVQIDGLDMYGLNTSANFLKLYFGMATSATVKNVRFFTVSGDLRLQSYGTTFDDFYSESLSLESENVTTVGSSPAKLNVSVFNRPTYYRASASPWSGSIRLADYTFRNPTFLNNCWDGSTSGLNTLGGTPTSSTKIRHYYTFKNTAKTGVTAIQSAKFRYYRAVQSSQGTPTWSAPPNAVIDTTSDASGTFTAIDLLDAYWEGPTLNQIERYNWTAKVRKYDYRSQAETIFTGRVLYQGTTNMSAGYSEEVQMSAVPYLTLIESAAAALTGIAMSPTAPTPPAIDTTTGTVTVTVAHTVAELWQWWRQWIATPANYSSQDTWTYDGTTLNVGAWSVVVTGVTLTGNLTTTSTTTGTGTYQGITTSSAGISGSLTITGLTSGTTVAVYDGSNAQQDYVASSGTTYNLLITASATGTWKYVIKRPGYAHQFGTFSADGATTVAASLVQVLNPDGTAMYGGTSSGLVAVSFTGTTQANIDIGDGLASLQATYDTAERALVTASGMAWLNSGKTDLRQFNSAGGDYLFLSTAWRLRRAASGNVNATLNAFAQSVDGSPVDSVNGSVAYLTSDSPAAIAAAVWAAASRTLTAYTLPTGERIVVMNPSGQMLAR